MTYFHVQLALNPIQTLSALDINWADQYDALVSRRVYKQPFTHSKAVKLLEKEKEHTLIIFSWKPF